MPAAQGLPTKLCLVVAADVGAAERLATALGLTDAASVIIAPPPGRPLDAAMAQPLLETAQRAGAAGLLLAEARLARTLKADGVHIPACDQPLAAYQEAREILGRGGIVGVDAGRSRHDAMELGEAGADYVGFGIPAAVKEQDKARERRLELVAWWAEIFEVPCVALDVAGADAAADLATAGADFVAVALSDGLSPAELRDWLAAHASALAGGAAVT